MPSIAKSLRVLTDPSRLRIVCLLEREELSVAELQEILGMGQSRISTHLAQLKQAELVEDRRSGKNILYRLRAPEQWNDLLNLVRQAAAETSMVEQDDRALAQILRKRSDRTRAYFDGLAGKFGRHYVPGRSWKGLAETLLALMPPLDIADLGCGEATFTLLMARSARSVIGVDNSEKMIAYARGVAESNGVGNVEFRTGDLESPPIDPASVDVAFFSQSLHHALHPERAVAAAHAILRPGGRIVVLDLKSHSFEGARELYADIWLGFSESKIAHMLHIAGFEEVRVETVHREEEQPNFETVLAVGRKPLP